MDKDEFFIDSFHDSGGMRRHAVYRQGRLKEAILCTVDWSLAKRIVEYLNKIYKENTKLIT